MRFTHLLPLFALFSLAAAHGTHRRRDPTPEDIVREEIRAREHAVMARNCEPQVREHVAMRMRRRAEIHKREAEAAGGPTPVARAIPPHYTNIQNTTCLTAPETVEGPYYINNEFVRLDIRESQPGAQLLMDFGVLDTSTCTPMNYTFVEIWHANATGDYGGYSSGFNGKETWLRGGWYSDANGMVEIATIFPGYYAGRAPHIHVMVHKDWTQSNGTLVSHSGTLIHVGQIFFPETWNDQVFRTSPYSSNSNQRTLNNQDSILARAFQGGHSAYTSLQYLNGNDLSGGLVGYITLGVDSRSSYTIKNTNNAGSTVGNSGNTDASTADSQWRGWANAFYLSLLVFAFFGYGYAPNFTYGMG